MQFYARSRRKPAIIIVSLIDILAILLIFFIVTTTFKRDQPQVKINLPESASAVEAPAESQPLLISIDSEDKVYVDGEEVDFVQLDGVIADIIENSPERGFALQADKDAGFGVVIRVMDTFQQNGIKNLPAFTEVLGQGGGG